jgi:hypothetical protein
VMAMAELECLKVVIPGSAVENAETDPPAAHRMIHARKIWRSGRETLQTIIFIMRLYTKL